MTILKTALALVLLTGPFGCAAGPADDGSDCVGAKCDDLDIPDSEVPDTVCDGLIVDESGRNNQKVGGRLNDAFANAVFKQGDSCPTSFEAIMEKMQEFDNEGSCADGEIGTGNTTRLVSETAQIMGEATNYRAVTTRTCGDRSQHELIFSLFGLQAGARQLPGAVEIIAFDKTQGVFNYYEANGREIAFFGNSKDMFKGRGGGQVRRCAGCHTGGGLVMKELDTPWMHWEGHEDLPGARELVEAHAVLGNKSSGSNMESLTKAGNREWNKTRLAHFQELGDLKELLRPLFCTVEVNIDNGADFGSPPEGGEGGSQVSSVKFDALLDRQLKGFGSIAIEFSDYDALIKANGQRVRGIPGAVDTLFDMPFIERSHADNDFVDKLVEANILDKELVKDVLMVDFTRPVFSDDRCDLLEFVPELAPEDMTADNIRAGLIENLGRPAGRSPEEELLKYLESEAGHDEKVTAYTDACSALDKNDFLVNAMTMISLNRKKATALAVFEFPQTLPEDNLEIDPNTRLNPTDCSLVTNYVSIAD